MHRFFIPVEWFQPEGVVFIKGSPAHQLRYVLRLRQGDNILVLDNSGWEYQVELKEWGKDYAMGVIKDKTPASGEPATKVTLYQALLKGDKFDFVLQKGTELGITAFVPLFCQRCIIPDELPRIEHKMVRWQKIIQEAAEQSGRGKIPFLSLPLPLQECCSDVQGLSLLAWEGEKTRGLKEILHRQSYPLSANVFIGPEGGFTFEEVEFARECGIQVISLGKRILRAETAGLAMVSAILYEGGD